MDCRERKGVRQVITVDTVGRAKPFERLFEIAA